METKNLMEILKNCPEGTELCSLIHGEVKFISADTADKYPIVVAIVPIDKQTCTSAQKKVERFDPNTLKPFDRVLVRYSSGSEWCAAFFSHVKHGLTFQYIVTPCIAFGHIIPYKDNEHLVGKVEEPEEYYRYWEDEISKEDGQTAST